MLLVSFSPALRRLGPAVGVRVDARASRSSTWCGGSSRGLGAAGEVLGVIGALLGGLALTWWTAVVLGLRAL
jgi:hypothetical protein